MDGKSLATRIEKALDELRPYLITDGGNIRLVEISGDMTVKLEFQGACSNCSMSPMTFKAGIEQAIRRAAPEVKAVQVVNMVW